jgi:hypothetical protein
MWVLQYRSQQSGKHEKGGSLMLYMVVATHNTGDCPMTNLEVRNKTLAASKRSPEVSKSLGITQQGSWTNLANHTVYTLIDAPNAHAISQMMQELQMLDWNIATIEPVFVTQEVMAKYLKPN